MDQIDLTQNETAPRTSRERPLPTRFGRGNRVADLAGRAHAPGSRADDEKPLPSRSPTTSRSSKTAAASDQLTLLMCRRSCEPVGEDGHAVLENGRVGELELRRRRFGEQQIVGGAATDEERMEPEPQLVQ